MLFGKYYIPHIPALRDHLIPNVSSMQQVVCMLKINCHPQKTKSPDLLRFSTSHFCTLAEHFVPLQAVNISNKSLMLHSVKMNTLCRSTFMTRAYFTEK